MAKTSALFLIVVISLTASAMPGSSRAASPTLAPAASPPSTSPARARSLTTDLLIVGGTEAGWAAAIQAARMGVKSITIVHDGNWLGGQYTEQALACVDENKGNGKVGWGVDWHPMKRSFHRSGLFRELMDNIEAHNKKKYGDPMPGRPWHGPTTFRPAEAQAVFHAMLQPYIETSQVRLILEHYPVAALKSEDGQRLLGLRFAPVKQAAAKEPTPSLTVHARLTIDASDFGEAIQVSGAGFDIGPDPRARYGEPSAPVDTSIYPPNEMNPITWCMIIEEGEGDQSIEKPKHFDHRKYFRATQLTRKDFADLSWDRNIRRAGGIAPWPGKGDVSRRQLSVYTVRRVVDGYAPFAPKVKPQPTAILLCFMLGQDYPLERLPKHVAEALEKTEKGAATKNYVTMTRAQRQIIFDDAKQHALGVLYHMQTLVHDRAKDKTHSFRRFKLSDEFGTADQLPPKPYIRESLRLKAMYMMREQDGRNTDGPDKRSAREAFAKVMYTDGVGCWQFHYDFHRTGRTYLKGDADHSGPWVDYEKPGRHTRTVSDRSTFPLRSLIPAKLDGLLGAQKNVGYSSIVSAAIRLHDQCVAIGQAAGAAAAVCLQRDVQPRAIPYDLAMLEAVREGLCGQGHGPFMNDQYRGGPYRGMPLQLWPFRDVKPGDPWFVAVNRLAARGGLPMSRREVDFRGDAMATDEWARQVVALSLKTKLHRKPPQRPSLINQEGKPITRGAFVMQWWDRIQHLPDAPIKRVKEDDADGDGIKDADDALYLTPTPWSWTKAEVDHAPNMADLLAAEKHLLSKDGGRDLTDGLPNGYQPAMAGRVDEAAAIVVNFAGPSKQAAPGKRSDNDGAAPPFVGKAIVDAGGRYDETRGYGWLRDLAKSHRQRGKAKHPYMDSFLFTRTHDTWRMKLPNGKVVVTVCIGDAGHEQIGQHVSVQGRGLIVNANTPAGRFLERSTVAEVRDGKLVIEIGKPGGNTNTCINWLRIDRLVGENER